MGACDHCLPLQQESARWWQVGQDLVQQWPDLRAQADAALAAARAAIDAAWTAWRLAYHQFQVAEARLDALVAAASQGAGAPAADIARHPVDGWIEVRLSGSLTMWARTQDAADRLAAGVGAAAAQAQLAAAQADFSAAWQANQDALEGIEQAEEALERTRDEWQQRFEDHHQAIQDAKANELEFDRRYRACIRACRRGEPWQPLVAAASALLLLGGVGAIAAGDPFAAGGRAAEAAAVGDVVGEPVDATDAPTDAEVTPTGEPDEEPVERAPTVRRACTGTDHYPERPATDGRTGEPVASPSKQIVALSLADVPERQVVAVDLTGPDGVTWTAYGEVGPDGTVELSLPLFQYGEHTIDRVEIADGEGGWLPLETGLGPSIVVSDPEDPCDTTTVGTGSTLSAGTWGTALPPEVPGGSAGGTGERPSPAPTSVDGGGTGPGPGETEGTGTTGGGTGAGASEPPRSVLAAPPTTTAAPPTEPATTAVLAEPGKEPNTGLVTAGAGAAVAGAVGLAASTATRRREEDEVDGGAKPTGTAGDAPGDGPPGTGARDVTETETGDEEEGWLSRTITDLVEEGPALLEQGLDAIREKGEELTTFLRDGATWLYGGTYSDGTATEGAIRRTVDAVGSAARFVLGPTDTPRPRTTVSIDTGGRGEDSVTEEQPFTITVDVPRSGDEEPAETIEVELTTEGGEEETLTLRWTGNVTGPARYTSEPATLEDGAEGGGRVTIVGLEFSSGGFSGIDTENGELVTITYDGASTSFRAYTTWVQQGIGRSLAVIEQYETFWTKVLEELEDAPSTPEVESIRRWGETVLELARLTDRAMATDELDTTKYAHVTTYASVVTRDLRNFGDTSIPGGIDWQTIGRWIRHKREDVRTDVLNRGLSGIAIAFYRTVVGATPAESAWTLFTGSDVLGKDVHWSEQVLAAFELAGWAALGAGTEARALADALPGTRRFGGRVRDGSFTPDEGAWTERSRGWRRPDPSLERVPAPRLRGTDAGRDVTWTEDFGMLRDRARHIQSVADRYGVRIRVRASNFDALDWMSQGHPPKHVKLKSKTINDLDVHLGAPKGSQGLVGYFEPRMPSRRPPGMDDATWSKLRERYAQRAREYADNAGDMRSLQDKGLVEVRDGVVVDTGLSNTRLVGDELYELPGDAGGTGKAFTGDHDLWDLTTPDGRPLDPDLRSRVETDLMSGPANTQHGAHKDWNPTAMTDLDAQKYWQNVDIDAHIRGSHAGRVEGGQVRPGSDGAEPLLEFGPGQGPRTAYDTDGMPAVPPDAPPRPTSGGS